VTFDSLLFFISGGGFLVGVFAAALLLGSPRGDRTANRFLAMLMFVSAFNIIHPTLALLQPHAFIFRDTYLAEPAQFLMAPLIATYVSQLMNHDHRFRPVFLLHVLPFVGAVIFTVSPLPGILNRSADFPVSTVLLWVLLVAQVFEYVIPAFRKLARYRAALLQQVSNTTDIDLGWVRWLMHVIYGLYGSYVVVLVFVVHRVDSLHVRAFLSAALCAYICALAYRGLLQKETPRLEEVPAAAPAAKYERGAVPPDEARELCRKLEQAMESGKLYLDPDLDLSALAARVGAARNQLSYVINQNFGRNFYDFVNEYRVREVLRFMEDGSRANDKMLTLAFDAGFNSKPTFNSVFKKITGRTPSDYRHKKTKRPAPEGGTSVV
jgi:AraC-like DNA-binding protein